MDNLLYYGKKYGKDVLLFLLIIICLGLLLYNTFIKEEQSDSSMGEVALTSMSEKTEKIEEVSTNTKIHVDVKGAVKKPGVYTVNEGTIIEEVIKLAGGFQTKAYQNGINLSKKVKDEMVIYIYTKTEIAEKEKEQEKSQNELANLNETCKVPDYSICECVQDKVSIIETDPNAPSLSDSNKEDSKKEENTLVNINTATVEELTSISGIGESKAKAIIAYRVENGKFQNITDIMNVSGIGESLFAKIKDYITI